MAVTFSVSRATLRFVQRAGSVVQALLAGSQESPASKWGQDKHFFCRSAINSHDFAIFIFIQFVSLVVQHMMHAKHESCYCDWNLIPGGDPLRHRLLASIHRDAGIFEKKQASGEKRTCGKLDIRTPNQWLESNLCCWVARQRLS